MSFGWAKTSLGRDIARRYAAGESIRALCGLLGDLGHAVGHGSLRSWLKRKGVSRGSVVPDDWTPPGDRQVGAASRGVCTDHADLIRQMAAAGHSTPDIAQAVAKAAGVAVSRNSVLAWCHRQGVVLAAGRALRNGARPSLSGVAAVSGGPFRLGREKLEDNKPPTLKPRKLADVAGGATIITRRRDGCAFLGGGHEPATQDTPCCNAPVVPGTSWCATHRAAVFSGHKDVAA
jgi:hypothetical protein